jgi:hypothetical protein
MDDDEGIKSVLKHFVIISLRKCEASEERCLYISYGIPERPAAFLLGWY